MKRITKLISLLLLGALSLALALSLASCGKKTVVIYTSAEDFRIEYFRTKMQEKFPQYNVVFEYKSSGDHAAIIKSAGSNAGCHITHDLEYGYATELSENFANLDGIIEFNGYMDDTVVSDYFAPELRNGGAIILNLDVIEEKGLDIPTSYEDLLDPQYKGLISMPNPKASGTGYMFLLSLVNAWGEEEALEYFDALSENVLSFTSSGSGPVNALVGKEVAVGFGMTSHAVQKINEGENLQVCFFEEGSPYSLYAQAIIKGYENDEAVVEVFKYLATELTREQTEIYYPEKVFTDTVNRVDNYPTEITYADMSNNTPERKNELLEKWEH